MNIGILGGTGNEGQSLALRWAHSGTEVLLGSREPAKAERVARELNRLLGRAAVSGLDNRRVAERADAIVSTLPYKGQGSTLEALRNPLAGKLVMIATVIWPPCGVDRRSAAEEAQETLGDAADVVAAFQTVSAVALRRLDRQLDEDVLVCGDRREARRRAIEWILRSGLRGVEAGSLRQARILEAMTGVLLQINKLHGIRSAGLHITGLE